ncbi:MAG TPA: nucleotidyl transferase AbiEii/AbiGii toxin family protein [Solirubrobacteraceae bacterium]|nr:nucleotidyl transferase AbiEii/AbiGii toxin family protein [Solirubrobacteraceae bacterium]
MSLPPAREHARRLDALSSRIVALHEMLDSLGLAHQFGGAIALAWYRSPRATTDIDVNVTLAPEDADPLLGALAHLGVTVTAEDRGSIERDGQARLDWDGYYLDVFCATLQLHQEMATDAREVAFGPTSILILSPEHLIVCKATFDRPKDWVDIEEMLAWGTEVDRAIVLRWIDELLGTHSSQHARLAELLSGER